jgi:hypothetical protein
MNQPTNNVLNFLLADFKKGAVQAEANEAFSTLIQSVREHGKKGTFVLELDVLPASGSDAACVEIRAKVKTKLPEPAPPAAIYYTTEDGRVQKDDPNQAELVFKPLPSISAPAVQAQG